MSPAEVFYCLFYVTLLLVIIYFLIKVERVQAQGCGRQVEIYDCLVQLIRQEVTRTEERRRLRRRRSENHIVSPNTNILSSMMNARTKKQSSGRFLLYLSVLWLKSSTWIYRSFFPISSSFFAYKYGIPINSLKKIQEISLLEINLCACLSKFFSM